MAGDDAGGGPGDGAGDRVIAYVTLAPIAGGLADRVPRRVMLITAGDPIRALVADRRVTRLCAAAAEPSLDNSVRFPSERRLT